MRQYGAFSDESLVKKAIVAHGPEIDLAGGYGVSIYQIADDQDIAAFTAEDSIGEHELVRTVVSGAS